MNIYGQTISVESSSNRRQKSKLSVSYSKCLWAQNQAPEHVLRKSDQDHYKDYHVLRHVPQGYKTNNVSLSDRILFLIMFF